MLSAEQISDDWGKPKGGKDWSNEPRVHLEPDTYEMVLFDVKLIKDVPIPEKYRKEGGPTTRDKLLLAFVSTETYDVNGSQLFAEAVQFINFSWGPKATLPKFLKAMDRKGFTDEVAARCGKDKQYLITYINSLIGRTYDVDVEPNKLKTKNYAVSAKLSRNQPNTKHPKLTEAKTTATTAVTSGFETMPDAEEDDLPF